MFKDVIDGLPATYCREQAKVFPRLYGNKEKQVRASRFSY
jgi:hypothetical protein